MQTAVQTERFSDLIKDFKEEAKTLLKQEVDLAKTEVSEKIAHLRKNAVILAIGGCLAYAGLIVLLGALGMFLAMAGEAMGLSGTLALGAGLGVIAFLVIAAGGTMVGKAIAGFKESASVAPEK